MVKETVKEKIIDYVEQVVKQIFNSMIFIEPIMEKPFIRNNGIKIPNRQDISGIIGLGGNFSASVIVHFEKDSALLVTSKMLGIDYLDIDKDVIDAVGEMTNMIAGGIKTKLADKGLNIEQSLPIVVSGKDFNTNCIASDESWIFPFIIDKKRMCVEFSFKD